MAFDLKKTFLRLAAVVAIGAVAGCALVSQPKDTGDLSSNPDYSAGYNDGCATATSRVQGFEDTVTRDQNRFKNSEAYRAGWRAGHTSCGGSIPRDKDVFGGEDRWYESGTIGSPN